MDDGDLTATLTRLRERRQALVKEATRNLYGDLFKYEQRPAARRLAYDRELLTWWLSHFGERVNSGDQLQRTFVPVARRLLRALRVSIGRGETLPVDFTLSLVREYLSAVAQIQREGDVAEEGLRLMDAEIERARALFERELAKHTP
jgi:hypothetical protein